MPQKSGAANKGSGEAPLVANPWLIAVSVILPTFMEVVDTSIASVALPHIAGSLSASTDEATWVLTSYLAANAIVLPASGWFAVKFGRKRFLLVCIVIFTAASFASGASTSLAMIMLARAIQGAGGGALQPLSQAILMESFPPAKRGLAMAVFGLGVVVAPIIGPTLGGWLTDQYSWRWAFYINIPVGILALIMISRFIEDPPYIRKAKAGRLDYIGFGLLAVGLGTLQIVLDKGQENDWFAAAWIRWASVAVGISLVVFVIRQLTIDRPIVDLRILTNRNFGLGCLLIALFGSGIYGLVTLLPLFYQTLMRYTASAAGLAVSPRGLGAVVIMPVVGFLGSKLDNRMFIALGFLLFGLAGLWFGGLTLDVSQWSFFWPIVISGVAAGMVFVPLTTTTMGTLSNEQMGNAAGLFNLARNIGGSAGISILNTMVIRHQQLRRSEMIGHLNPLNTRFQQTFAKVQGVVATRGGPGTPQHKPYALVQQLFERQIQALSYVDIFRFIAIGSFACILVVFMLRGVTAKEGATAAH